MAEITPSAGRIVLRSMLRVDPAFREVLREVARRALLALQLHEQQEVLADVEATRAERERASELVEL